MKTGIGITIIQVIKNMAIHDNQAWSSYKCWVLVEYINSNGIAELNWDFHCLDAECNICHREIKDLNIVAIIGISRSLEYVNIKNTQ